jgi:hypothetical protein
VVIRNHYRFNRPLSAPEIELLTMLIGWRKGSSVTTVGDAVVGCVSHPDDLAEFEQQLRKQGARLEAMILI